ncbi:MAG TPA: AMP-binding protein [Pyrinomonadaceae bacterium]|nr:AMP-binding protein [Pyrinomonadaceae bacterium]
MQYKSLIRETLLSYLDDYAQRGRERMFVQKQGLRLVSWTYEEIVVTARRTARELEACGIAKGDHVLLCGENSAEWAAAFWGCLLRGVVVVPLDKGSAAEFTKSVQFQTNAKLVFADSRTAAIEQLNIPVLPLHQLAETTASHSSEPYSLEDIGEDSTVEIIFTSGTTSTPKGAVLTHRNLLANLLPLESEIAKYLKWERIFHPLRLLNLVPLSHVFGQFMGLFVAQLLGGEVHFQNTLNPAETVRRMRESRISVIILVPRMLGSLREWVERTYPKLKPRIAAQSSSGFIRKWWTFRHLHRQFGLKFWAFISGGATLDEQTENFWQRLGFAVLQGYGMTETASLVTVTHPFKRERGSIGKPLPGYEVKLDENGEILLRGASVSAGYWSSEKQFDQRRDEWLHTGDLGAIDESGNLYFKGRDKDVIVTSAGVNIHPADLEDVLNRQPEVRASCVIARQGARGDEPLAVLILRDIDASVEATIARANQSLAEHQRIRHWHVWREPDFPRTPTQKVLKREVESRIKTETANATVETASSFVISAAEKISGEAASRNNPSSNLTTDLKLDSLGRVELLSELEDRYQIEIDEAAFTAATTIGDVDQIVRGGVEERVAPYPYPKWSQKFPVTWIRVLLSYTIILPITRIMSRMQVEGREHVENLTDPVLFIANHVTVADHALILAALPARLRHRLAVAMEGERLRNWLHPPAHTTLLMRLRFLAQYILVTTFFHVFPLPKRSGFRRSFSYAGECIDRGESVLVFPEGERARRGHMQMSDFKSGIGILAKELNVAVVPIKLYGLYELKRRKQYFASPGMVSVVFGEPVKFESHMKPSEIAEELHRIVTEL